MSWRFPQRTPSLHSKQRVWKHGRRERRSNPTHFSQRVPTCENWIWRFVSADNIVGGRVPNANHQDNHRHAPYPTDGCADSVRKIFPEPQLRESWSMHQLSIGVAALFASRTHGHFDKQQNMWHAPRCSSILCVPGVWYSFVRSATMSPSLFHYFLSEMSSVALEQASHCLPQLCRSEWQFGLPANSLDQHWGDGA